MKTSISQPDDTPNAILYLGIVDGISSNVHFRRLLPHGSSSSCLCMYVAKDISSNHCLNTIGHARRRGKEGTARITGKLAHFRLEFLARQSQSISLAMRSWLLSLSCSTLIISLVCVVCVVSAIKVETCSIYHSTARQASQSKPHHPLSPLPQTLASVIRGMENA